MPTLPGRDAVMAQLHAEGVRQIFGNPGTTEGALMYALEAYPDLAYYLVTQEGVAMGMADGFARASGRTAFVNLHIETGVANGLSLMFEAYARGTPLVLTSVNSDLAKVAEGRTDLAGLVRPFAKWSVEVARAADIPAALRRAFLESRTPPTGPTYVGFAQNALDEVAEVDIRPSPQIAVRVVPDPVAIAAAAEIIVAATNPVLLLGDRVAQFDAVDGCVRLAEAIGARVVGNSYPAMLFPTDHPLWCGFAAPYARFYHPLLQGADTVIAIGAHVFHDFFSAATDVLPVGANLIHIDCNNSEIGRSQPTAVGIAGDPARAVDALLAELETSQDAMASDAARMRNVAIGAATTARRASGLTPSSKSIPMSPFVMTRQLASALPPETLLVDDSVTTRAALHQAIAFNRKGSVHAAGAGGALGWGMGAALGVQIAYPDRPVVAVVGDGSAMMTIQGLWTAGAYGLPVVYVICNNASYRVLKVNLQSYLHDTLGLKAAASRFIGMEFPQPIDFASIAEGMGVAGRRIERAEDVAPAVTRALQGRQPALLDVRIDGSL